VTAFSFGVPVTAVWVAFSSEKGWHGATDTPPGSANHLPCKDRITLLIGGKAAEEFFDCPAHQDAWLLDFGEIASLLNRNEVPSSELWPRIDEGKAHARAIFEKYRDQTLRLTDRLVDRSRVDDVEFLRLMSAV
jgi:hypothetical protein